MTEYYRPGQQPLTPYEISRAVDIYEWKNSEPGVVSFAVGQVLAPINWAIQKIIPEKAIMGALDLANRARRKWPTRGTCCKKPM